MPHWSLTDMPPQDGKVIIVTGGNSGLGFESVKALACKGATVVLAARNADKAAAAKAAIDALRPSGSVEPMSLDLASFASVRAFADAFRARFERLDVLMNNAGIMAIAERRSADGFELQFATNHLGHFLLTGLLLDTLLATRDSRVVALSSLAANGGRIRFKDLDHRNGYRRWNVYCQSKLANMLFARELHRRLSRRQGHGTISLVAHPGVSATNLQDGPADGAGLVGRITPHLLRPFCQPQDVGALPQLRAATEPGLAGDTFFGPSGFMQLKGAPVAVAYPRSGCDLDAARVLWERSMELTGADYGGL